MAENDTTDTDETTGTTRRWFARSVATVVGGLSLSGLAAAHHDDRTEQGERHGNDDGAHGNGNGRERRHDDDDAPGNSGEHRRDDEHRDDREEDDDDESDDEDVNDDDDENEDNGDGGGDGNVQVTAERQDDGSVFFLPSGPGANINQVDLVVQASQPVFVRDQFPSDWTVVEGDLHTTYTDGDTRFVEFTDRVEDGTRTYFAAVPDNTGADEFGPIEYSLDGETWTEITGTTETNLVVAGETSLEVQ